MKTIFDAVNEFKGEWPYKTKGMVESKGDQACYEKGELSDYYSDNPDRLNLDWFNFTCNKKGFDALVDAMSTNFGECSPINVSDYKIVIKTLLKPEPTKQTSSTYTQEMFDNSVFPSAGMECQTSTGIIAVKYVGKKVVVCEDSDGDEYTTSKKSALHSFKPLTPPVPLIDGKAYQFECDGFSDLNGIYSELDHSFYNNLGDSEVADCTNIQPLTLAGE